MIVDIQYPSSYQGRGRGASYSVFSAVSKALPWLHDHPALGLSLEYGALVIRAPVELAPHLARLGGRMLAVDGVPMTLGQPQILSLAPCSRLSCPRVTVKSAATRRCMDRGDLVDHVARQFDERRYRLGSFVVGEAHELVLVAKRTIVAWPVTVEGLDDASSVDLLERGLGGRRKMGCGLFQPAPS